MRQPSSRSISRRPSSRRLISAATSRASPRSVVRLCTLPDPACRRSRLSRIVSSALTASASRVWTRLRSVSRSATIRSCRVSRAASPPSPWSLVPLPSQRVVQLFEPLPHPLRVALQAADDRRELVELVTRLARQLLEQLFRGKTERELRGAMRGGGLERVALDADRRDLEEPSPHSAAPEPAPETARHVAAPLQPHHADETRSEADREGRPEP